MQGSVCQVWGVRTYHEKLWFELSAFLVRYARRRWHWWTMNVSVQYIQWKLDHTTLQDHPILTRKIAILDKKPLSASTPCRKVCTREWSFPCRIIWLPATCRAARTQAAYGSFILLLGKRRISTAQVTFAPRPYYDGLLSATDDASPSKVSSRTTSAKANLRKFAARHEWDPNLPSACYIT